MPKEFSRTVRVADQIQRTLAQLIQTEMADPRVGMVNINAVDVSPDYAHAKIFVTFVDRDDDDEVAESIVILNKAAGYLRNQLARTLNSRTTPKLLFQYDKTVVKGQRLTQLIDRAVAEDQGHQQ